ncbi:hypothetical protein ACHAPS_006748 [Verticillium nonalfalfae]
MTSVKEQPQFDPAESPTREQLLEQMQAHIDKVRREHPDWDVKPDTQWWVPGIHFSEDIKEQINPEKHEKYNACFKRMQDAKFERSVVYESLDEARTCLTDDEGLLKRFDEMFHDREALASIHEHMVAQEAQETDR